MKDINQEFFKACKDGDFLSVVLLLKKGAEPDFHNHGAFFNAVLYGHYDIVKLLLKNPKIDPRTLRNLAIRWAAENGHENIVKLLLQDSRVNPADLNNDAIRSAYRNGHYNIVKLLLQNSRVRKTLVPEELEKYEKIVKEI